MHHEQKRRPRAVAVAAPAARLDPLVALAAVTLAIAAALVAILH